MGVLLVVTGPPGAGKSTVAEIVAASFACSAWVRGDEFFGFIRQGFVAPWLPAAHEQNQVVTKAAAAAAGRIAGGGYTVVYDGVIGPWLLPEFAAACDVDQLHYAVLMPPEAVVVERVSTRQGHGFKDLDAARHMYADFLGAKLDPRHVVSGGGDSHAVAKTLRARMDAGELAWS